MRNILTNIFALGLVAGIIGFAAYFFAFGQAFEGEIEISAAEKIVLDQLIIEKDYKGT